MQLWPVGGRIHGRSVLALGVAALFAMLAAVPAQAAPTWLSPARVGPITSPTCLPFVYVCDAEIAVAPNGTAYLATAHYDGTATNKRRVSVSIRRPGAAFGARQFLSPAGADSAGFDGAPLNIAIDRQGNVTVAWAHTDPVTTRTVVQAAYKPASAAAFRPAETLSNETVNADMPDVAAYDNGGAIVIWRNNNGGASTIQRSFRAPGALTFGSLSDISGQAAAAAFDDPQVVAAPNGNATAIWKQDTSIVTNVRPAGQGFTGPLSISLGGVNPINDQPDVAIAPTGQVTAVWRHDPDLAAGAGAIVHSRERSASPNFGAGNWSGFGTVSEAGETGASPSVAVNNANTAVAVWSGNVGGETTVRAAVRAGGASFTGRAPISGPGASAFAPQVEIAPDGAAVATWSLGTGGVEMVQSARRPPGGTFGAVDIVMQGTPFPNFKGVWFRPPPTLGFDAEGNAFATWIGYTGSGITTRNFIEVAGFDAAPPAFASMSVPNTGVTGRGVAMRASVVDRLTAASVRWSFGDGSTANGAAVTKAYTTPGVYTVTATARDAVGNVRSATRTIQISRPAGIDADGDGFVAGTAPGQDCNDGNPGISPGAAEVRGNGVDENCDGRRLPLLVTAGIPKTTWSVLGSRHTLLELKIRNFARGMKVELRCLGKKCKFKKVRVKGKPKRGVLNALKALKGGKKTLRAGQTLEVRITQSKRIGRVTRYKLRANKIPSSKQLCLPPGTRKSRRC